MKKNKNIIAFAMTLSIFGSLQSHDDLDQAEQLIEETENRANVENKAELVEQNELTPAEINHAIEQALALTQRNFEIIEQQTSCNNHDELTAPEKAVVATMIIHENETADVINSTETIETITEQATPCDAIVDVQTITLEQAVNLLQETTEALKSTIDQEENDINAENEAERKLNSTEKDIITTIVTNVINCIATEIQEYQNHEITKNDAIKLLQTCIDNLVIGSQFSLNGITYLIVDESNN